MHAKLRRRIRPAIAVLVVGAASVIAYGQSASLSDGTDDGNPEETLVEPDSADLDLFDESVGRLRTKHDSLPDESADNHDDAIGHNRYTPSALLRDRPSRSNQRPRVHRTTVDLDYVEFPTQRVPAISYQPGISSQARQTQSRHRHADPVDRKTTQAIRATLEKLRDASDDESRTAAAAELKKLLETAFDRDYDRRHDELARLEERVAKLRTQLDRRKESRDDIIDVRVKSLLYDAEGISFPDGLGTMRRAPGSVGQAKNRRSVVRQWVEVAPGADDAPNYGEDSPKRRERAPR